MDFLFAMIGISLFCAMFDLARGWLFESSDPGPEDD